MHSSHRVEPPSVTSGTDYDDEAYLRKRTVEVRSSLALSPDGQWIAMVTRGLVAGATASDSRDEGGPLDVISEELVGSEVVIIHTGRGEILRPFQNFRSSFAPAWSPQGERLVLLCQDGERRFSRLTLWKKGEEPRVVEEAPMAALTGFVVLRWTKDARKIIFKKSQLRASPAIVRHQTTADIGIEVKAPKALAVLDVENGHVQTWGEMSYSCGWHLSPDQSQVVFVRAVASPVEARHNQASYRQLVVANLSDGSEQALGEPQPDNWGASFSWSPDGKAIAWVCAAHQSPTQLFLAELSDPDHLRSFALPPHMEFGWFDVGWYPPPAPRWNAASTEFWLPGRGQLWHFTREGQVLDSIPLPEEQGFDWLCNSVTALDTVTLPSIAQEDEEWLLRPNQVWKANLVSGEVESVWKKAPELPRLSGYWTERAFHAPTNELYTAHWTTRGQITLYRTSLLDGETRRIAVVAEGLAETRYGAVHHLKWTLPHGTACGGTLLLPVNWTPGQKPPVVMNVYGNERSNGNWEVNRLHDAGHVVDLHLLSAHGFAAFVPDLPQTEAEPAASLVRAGEAAVAALKECGLVDAERVCPIGSSYGGYTTVCLLTGSKLFRAGVAANGVYDLADMATQGGWGWAEAGQGLMRATLWENPERYWQNSPLYQLDQLEAPLLILQGGEDAWSGGKALFSSLQRLGKQGELLTYRDAGHSPISWSIAAQRDLHQRLLAFLQEQLGPL